MQYIKICITPPIRAAIKNLFLETFNYETVPEHHILEPSADANDMRLNLHKERISNNEIALAKIDIVAETVAREVADMKLAKAAGPFEREERRLRLNPQYREEWEGLRKKRGKPLLPWSKNS